MGKSFNTITSNTTNNQTNVSVPLDELATAVENAAVINTQTILRGQQVAQETAKANNETINNIWKDLSGKFQENFKLVLVLTVGYLIFFRK